MKLATYDHQGRVRLGALLDPETLLDLAAARAEAGTGPDAALGSMQALIEAGPAALEETRGLVAAAPAGARVALRDVTLLAPLPRPVQMRDFLCFETHLKQSIAAMVRMQAARAHDPAAAEEAARASGKTEIPAVWYRQPVYYKCNRFAVTGPDRTVVWPVYSEMMDFELEMAAVIGIGGRDIPKEGARDHIFGYTVFNDLSARDAQSAEMPGMLGPAKGKDFDEANVLGPYLVTADEIPDLYALTMTAKVNGEIWAEESSGSIHWTFEDMIAHASRGETLYPGEVIGSGTVGNGCGLEHMRFLGHGDRIDLTIERIGTLTTTVKRPEGAAS